MLLAARKKRPLDRTEAVRDAKLVVLATEGEKTEKIYFEAFGNSRVQIVIIPSEGGKSSPAHVLSNLQKYKDEYQLFPEDEMWLVIDKDRWPLDALYDVAAISKDVGFGLALSNPSFEIWLSYHYDDQIPSPATAESLIRHLRVLTGSYSKNKFDATLFAARASVAVRRAEADDKDPDSPWPEPHGSRVYKVIAAVF